MKLGETIFSKKFSRRFFSIRRVTTRRAKHDEKTHKERTKQKKKWREKVKRISSFLEAFFFFEQKQGDKEDIFQKEFENTDKWQHVFWRSCMGDGFRAKSGKIKSKCFSERIVLRKESMIFWFLSKTKRFFEEDQIEDW